MINLKNKKRNIKIKSTRERKTLNCQFDTNIKRGKRKRKIQKISKDMTSKKGNQIAKNDRKKNEVKVVKKDRKLDGEKELQKSYDEKRQESKGVKMQIQIVNSIIKR